MNYISTRGRATKVRAGQAIIQGIAPDGGLYVPESFPNIANNLGDLINLPYNELAFEILKLYLTDYSSAELKSATNGAYSYPNNFYEPSIAPLKESGGVYFLELFHGRTHAFKDIALSILPYLLTTALNKERPGEKTIILVATSGDTGKAALESFAGIDGVTIVVFYPEDGVSDMQKLQMLTQEGDNTHVIGIRGNFDDAQTGVKGIFNNEALKEAMKKNNQAFSSANSINIGRLLPQIVYYVYAYAQLAEKNIIKIGDPVDFNVPTGNFGNILAGYYAKKMGLPINKLICASNQNNILFDFLRTGTYDSNRRFYTTMSPSMDILISSNLERLLFHIAADKGDTNHVQCGDLINSLMVDLQTKGEYNFPYPMGDFYASYATEEETRTALADSYSNAYVIDTHTAVGFNACKKYQMEKGSNLPHIVVSTASPFKFASDVYAAISGKPVEEGSGPFYYTNLLADKTGLEIPNGLRGLDEKSIRHTSICDPCDMLASIEKILQ